MITTTTVVDFMNDGVMLVCGFELTKEDVVVKREFSGDAKRYEAAVSEDGSLMIAIDATCDEEVLQELRAKTVAATVQRLRKSCGLVVGDRVEIFYEEGAGKGAESAIGPSLAKHAATTIARIKSLPLPMALCSPQAIVIVKEIVNDPDISKSPVTIVLTQVGFYFTTFVPFLDGWMDGCMLSNHNLYTNLHPNLCPVKDPNPNSFSCLTLPYPTTTLH